MPIMILEKQHVFYTDHQKAIVDLTELNEWYIQKFSKMYVAHNILYNLK